MVDDENIPIEDALDDEAESPYRRRAKAVPVRRGRLGRWRRLLRWMLVGVCVAPVLGYSGYLLARYMLTSPRFLLTSPSDVMVSGNRFVSHDDVVGALGLPLSAKLGGGISILRVSLEKKREQVMTIPWVQSATVARAYPHALAVNVVERTPVAFLNLNGRLALVDGEGVLLDKPEKASFDFPVVTGLDEAGDIRERKARIALYEEFLRSAGADASTSGWLISEVDLSDPDDLKALLARGRETLNVHFGHQDFHERFQAFLTLLPELHAAQGKIDSIDLRYGNQIVVNPEEVSAASSQ